MKSVFRFKRLYILLFFSCCFVIPMTANAAQSYKITPLYEDKSITMIVGESKTLSFSVKPDKNYDWFKVFVTGFVQEYSGLLITDQDVENATCTITADTIGTTVVKPFLQYEIIMANIPLNDPQYGYVNATRYNIKIVSPNFYIDFDSTGGNNVNSKSVVWNKTIGTLPTPEREGYVFDGWYTEIEGGSKITSSSKFTYKSDLMLYARWIPNSYNIYLEANGGKLTEIEKEVVFGEKYGNLPIPTWENHTFLGWYTDSEAGTKITSNSVYADEKIQTLYAHWKNEKISVTGIELYDREISMNVGDKCLLLADVLPQNATDKSVIWSSSNEKIATVDDGLVTAISPGYTTVSVKTNDGEYSTTCSFFVSASSSEQLGNIAAEITSSSTRYYFDVSCSEFEEGAKVLICLYDADGSFLGVSVEPLMEGEATALVIAKNADAKSARIFVIGKTANPVAYFKDVDL